MAALDDESKRSALLEAVRKVRKVEDAAKAVGLTGRTVRTYAAKHEDFREQLAVARRQAAVVAHHAPRMLPECATIEGALDPDARQLPEHTRDAFLALVWEHANDAESKGCPKALHILAEYHIGADVHAARLRAQREAAQLEQAGDKSTRPVVIRSGAPRVPAVIDV